MLKIIRKSKILLSIVGISAFGLALLTLNIIRQPSPNSNAVRPEPDPIGNLEVAPVLGSLSPEFELLDLAGDRVKLSDFIGEPVVINFWATWCGPCRIEMPALEARFKEYEASGLKILAVDFDESDEKVRKFGDELGLTFTILLDPGANVQKLYRIRADPTSFFIDREGVIQVQHFGAMTEEQLDANLAQIGIGI